MQRQKRLHRHVDGLTSLDGPELVFGLVGAVGCDLDAVARALTEALDDADYTSSVIRVSALLHQLDRYQDLAKLTGKSEYERIRAHMDAGTELRSISKRGDIMAWLSVFAIRGIREAALASQPSGAANEPTLHRNAFVIKSIKNPAEIQTLRDVYGRAFFVLSAYAPRERRVKELAAAIGRSDGDSQSKNYRHQAEELIHRDEDEQAEDDLGQSVRDSFPLADVFIDTTSHVGMTAGVRRFVEGVFGYPFITPSRDEFGMYHAFASSLRSSDLGRQVGAAIASPEGEILSVGCNDVPAAGGGQYWTGDSEDHRDFRQGFDSSERFKQTIAAQLVQRLRLAGWSVPGSMSDSEAAKNLINRKGPLRGTPILGLLEFGRPVHAEMAAIVGAAHRGTRIHGATLFSTTFPCHLCARHIVAAGITRVVYVEPYPKSQAEELYGDSLVVDPHGPPGKRVAFEAFVGVAPGIHTWMFKNAGRKDKHGGIAKWSLSGAVPKLKRFVASYLMIEDIVVGELLPRKLREIGITPAKKAGGLV
jgi:deoxycytidylate deaminase